MRDTVEIDLATGQSVVVFFVVGDSDAHADFGAGIVQLHAQDAVRTDFGMQCTGGVDEGAL